jgi:hypothetical protein
MLQRQIISTHKTIMILFQAYTTYNWINNHQLLLMIIISFVKMPMKVVVTNSILCHPTCCAWPWPCLHLSHAPSWKMCLVLPFGHICNQGTQKDGLTKRGLQRIILDFYYIYYFMIIVDWYMTITRMMSC